MIIKIIKAKRILDSRNEPTIEVNVNNSIASSPSGKSTGKFETPSYLNNLNNSIKKINTLKIPFLIKKFEDLKILESHIKKIFNLKDPKQFGANALFALESAILKALSKEKNIPLYKILKKKINKFPTPVGNIIGGGLHSHNKDKPEFQEFLIIPNSKNNNIQLMNFIYKKIKSKIKATSINDEGAWQTSLTIEQILSILNKFKDIKIGIDVAASSFYKNSQYNYKNKSLNSKAQIHFINNIIKEFNLFYVEDPLDENDFKGFSQLKSSKNNLIVGDDLTATQISRLKKAIKLKSINAMIIKPNQNGSLIELKEIFNLCKKNNIKTIISHRSGETLDPALADYAVGFGADFIKTGISTPWRSAKLFRLQQIEREISKHQ